MSFIIKSFSPLTALSVRSGAPVCSVFQIREYAARKGTREKARKKKVKVEEKKTEFIPHNQRGLEKLLLNRPKRKFDDSWKQVPTDNVYPTRYYRWKVYPFTEAVQCHQETHHPTMYNVPDAPLKVIIELNMQGEKKTRFVDNFYRVAPMPNAFDHGDERNILAFAKDEESQKVARDVGAGLAGGIELIKEFQNGARSLLDFQYIVAHPNILPEMVVLRGLMKRKFPSPKNNTLGIDVSGMVKKYLHGITYQAVKDEHEQDFGLIECCIGPISMNAKHLEENFASLLNDVNTMKPRREGSFITRCLIMSPPSTEKLKVDHSSYINVEKNVKQIEEEQEGENDEEDEQKMRNAG